MGNERERDFSLVWSVRTISVAHPTLSSVGNDSLRRGEAARIWSWLLTLYSVDVTSECHSDSAVPCAIIYLTFTFNEHGKYYIYYILQLGL
jgi:hypothetical protein